MRLLLFICCVLSPLLQLKAQTFPTNPIQNNGDLNKRINFVYMGDGYTAAQQSSFVSNAQSINTALFTQSPFSNYVNFFNAYTIEVPSAQSGADHPGSASDEPVPSQPTQNVNTYFNSTFDYFNIHRLLVPTNGSAITTVLMNNLPQYDQAFIVVNSPYYGGSGGAYATSSTEANAAEVAIHEIGHSFADLSDEYWAGDIYAFENHNMTRQPNPLAVSWNEWYGDNGIGIYQHCCGGSSSSWYRPHQNCKMRYLGSPFCAVCTQRIIDVIYSLVTPVDNYTPTANTIQVSCESLTFDLDLIYPTPNTLEIEWLLNNTPIASNLETINIASSSLNSGANALKAVITDKTALSRSYLPQEGYQFSTTWTIINTPFISVDVKALLKGAMGSSIMNDNLRTAGLIPTQEPFSALGYTYVGGGGESIGAAVLNVTGNNAIADWVIIELRDKTSENTVLASRAALLQRDGNVVDLDGTSPVAFDCQPVDDYYVALRHRNHLGVMTALPVRLN